MSQFDQSDPPPARRSIRADEPTESPYRSLDPTTGEVHETFRLHSDAEVEAAVGRAGRAFRDWRRRPLAERLEVLERAAGLLDGRSARYAELMATEMGKPLAQGEGEAEKCAWVCRYYAENAEAFLRREAAESDGSEAWVRFDPLGPILAIMPWNFPFWQVFRFAAPALAAGNVAILKHAPNTPRCAAALAELFAEAGAPEGVFQNLYLSNAQAAGVIRHPCVRGVTLTGSTGAGREVARVAGRALRPMVMELGGSDPFLVFADAELDAAVEQGVASRCLNSGQSCIAAKRFLVARDVLEAFVERFVEAMRLQRMGDPKDRATEIGPLARRDLRDQLARQVEQAYRDGAVAACGGEVPAGDGFFYPPTVLTGLAADAGAARHELFGPVAVVQAFGDEAEALALANSTDYGLGASLWTGDRGRVERLIPELEAGSVFVNGMVKSDPRLPFGGVKASGFGRELAREGIREWVSTKTVWIR